MGKQGFELLEAFDALAPEDKQAFAVEILRRTRDLPFDSGPLTDADIGEAGKTLFAFLDQEENAARLTRSDQRGVQQPDAAPRNPLMAPSTRP